MCIRDRHQLGQCPVLGNHGRDVRTAGLVDFGCHVIDVPRRKLDVYKRQVYIITIREESTLSRTVGLAIAQSEWKCMSGMDAVDVYKRQVWLWPLNWQQNQWCC